LAPNTDDHWSRLAADLGLELGPALERPAEPPTEVRDIEPPAAAIEPEPLAAEPEAEELPPPAATRGRRRRSAASREDPDSEAPSAVRSRRGRPAPPVPDEIGEEELPVVTESEISGPPAEAEPASAEADATLPATEPVDGNEPAEDGKPRRRRRRSRRKKGEPGMESGDAVAPVQGAREAEPAQESTVTATDEPPEEVVSDWNVPSWEDLIASLHRPER
jgi:ribonuclease E